MKTSTQKIFEAVLVRALEAHARRSKRDWRSAWALFAEIGAQGSEGGYTLVTDFIRRWRSRGGKMLARAFVPLKFAQGEAFQFDTDFGNLASGREKGVVEKNVQDSRPRIWQEAGQRRFGRFAERNAWLLERCRAVWSQIRHPEVGDLTVAAMLAHEQPSLMPMPAPFDGSVETLGRVSSTALVTVARNRYCVPCEGVGQIHPPLPRARRPLEPRRRARVP